MQTTTTTKATDKQVAYAMSLMRRAGLDTRFMSGQHRVLGASMRERQGRVEDWLRSLSKWEASEVIDRLLSMVS
jgi:hypothetical protein